MALNEEEVRKKLKEIFYKRQDNSGTFYHIQASNDVFELMKQYAHEYAREVIGEDIEAGTAWDRQWEGRNAINIILANQRTLNDSKKGAL